MVVEGVSFFKKKEISALSLPPLLLNFFVLRIDENFPVPALATPREFHPFNEKEIEVAQQNMFQIIPSHWVKPHILVSPDV